MSTDRQPAPGVSTPGNDTTSHHLRRHRYRRTANQEHESFGQRHAGKAGANGQAESLPQPRDSFGGAGYGASNARVQSGRGWYAPAYVEHAPTQAVATLFRVLGDCAQDAGPTCACVPALRTYDAARSKQRIGGTHRCAHAWNGRGGETETAGAATRQVKVLDPRNPRYNTSRRLAVGEFILPTQTAIQSCANGLSMPVPPLQKQQEINHEQTYPRPAVSQRIPCRRA